MRMDKGDLESSHERVDVIPRVPGERDALLVARQIASTIGKQQFGWIRLIVKIGRPDRAAAVERLEIRARGANIAQRVDVAVHAQWRPVGGEVMSDVLTEEWLASLDVALGVSLTAIADAAFNPQDEQPLVVGA